jgi:hypothetical protein
MFTIETWNLALGILKVWLFSFMFQIKKLGTDQFLSPAIKTKAIERLSEYMNTYYGTESSGDDKPTCAICFDMSGTGKTTTIMEASKESNSIRAPISLINNDLFVPMLKSCKNMGEKLQHPLELTDSISYEVVESYFEQRFETVLAQLFQCITAQLNTMAATQGATIKVVSPKYISPTSVEFPAKNVDVSDIYKELVKKVNETDRLLVIHLDDCQEFFCGLTKTTGMNNGTLRVGDIMGLALRLFSKEVAKLKQSRHILWIFSGTRPNLSLEMRVASNFDDIYNVVDDFHDFDLNCVSTVLGNYYQLENLKIEFKSILEDKMKNLCGPPKFLKWFILSAQKKSLQSSQDLVDQWDNIEKTAIGLYRNQIQSTIGFFGLDRTKLKIYSRNLCWLHTLALTENLNGFLEFDDLPNDWIPFIEAGLIRVRQNGKWKLYPPNCFLVKIFKNYVNWFNWENIQNLVSNISASDSTTTLKGKIFEFLFALELCGLPESPLWDHMKISMKIQQNLNWNPKIRIMEKVDECLNQDFIYVMKDPDWRKMKTDVVFYAQKDNSPVRVLCQLTVQTKNSTSKANESLQEMLKIKPLDGTIDYRIFLAPKSLINISDIYKKNYNDNNCFFWDRDNFMSILDFPLDFCEPSKTKDSLRVLMDIAKDHNDFESVENIGPFLPGSSRKRKREFESMDSFYEALLDYGLNETQKDKVRHVMEFQEVLAKQLSSLTDAKLKEYGLVQGGLREAVLSVIEKK